MARRKLFYNSSVNNVSNVHVTNVYNKTVVNSGGASRASANGGPGGTSAKPTPAQAAAAHEQHIAPTAAQTQHVAEAKADPKAAFSANHGMDMRSRREKPLPGGGAGPGQVGEGGPAKGEGGPAGKGEGGPGKGEGAVPSKGEASRARAARRKEGWRARSPSIRGPRP